ncbi:hypothetical protein NQ317_014891 [Molorchus minor]|uniref:ZFAND1-like ubiquitin-like domain-containing protein n=1 Tax=Molorchus minor TaxID=1323400 RepID=A0ABQ9JCK6_9CUCU|nr:hypothetical protein NQ317_014891 [Molorchus minor]
MANKVQLMRIKNKATGLKTIPTLNRVYFNITYSKDQQEKTLPVFVSNQWTIGRAIDAIAQEMKLQNNNNKMNEKKLRLFKQDDKEIIYKDVSAKLDSLLNNDIIVNGESLIIEYVNNDCVKLV